MMYCMMFFSDVLLASFRWINNCLVYENRKAIIFVTCLYNSA